METVPFYKKPGSILRNTTLLCLLGSVPAAHADVPAGYYDSANISNPQALHSSLHEIIDDHQRFPYTSSSTDTWDILESADEDPANSSNIIDIYKNASYTKVGGGNSFYNREHTWPKSYGFPDDGSGNYPYTDTHHLFLSDSSYNSSRSNKPFANCTSACGEKITLLNNSRGGGAGESNWTGGSFSDGSWQTWSGRKGDTARAIMYMAVRYEGGIHGVTGVAEPDLMLTDDRSLINSSNTGNNASVAYMGLKSVLLQWHKEDPVDAFERRHNDTVYLYQGNRNPFVDHPEYAACVFENICSGGGDITAPDTPVGLSATGGDLKVTLNWTANSESDLAGYNIYRGTTSGLANSKVNATAVNTNSFIDTTVASDTTYHYIVRAIDTSFNQSRASLEVSAITDAGTPPPPPPTGDAVVWINEIHYDNASTDSGEAVEVAGAAGTNLSGWSLVGYNGNGGSTYKTIALSGVIADQNGGMGTLSFAAVGLQNGGPDGIALVDPAGNAVQFLSYEGSFTATNGQASGQTSIDILVAETSSTPAGYSLQLSGSGSSYADFTWQAAATSTFGAVNSGQDFGGGTTPPANEVPVASFSRSCNALACRFDASESEDSDGTISDYSWDFGDGETGSGVNPTHAYALAGEYNVVLTVTDNAGATDSIDAMVNVADLTDQPWVNEFHYDNASTDRNEGIEIAGLAGTDLSGWTIVAYNGSNGTHYKTVDLSGVIFDQQGGFGTINFAIAGLQNGSPDGFALVNNSGFVVQFLSYEGSLTAISGVAAGMTSTDVGVRESSSTQVGYSLQLAGEGTQYSDFTWQSVAASTTDAVNNDQILGEPNQLPVAAFTPVCLGLNCTFDASNSVDADGSIVAYSWDFADGNGATGVNPAYRFADYAAYDVTLTVTDDAGATAQTTMTVDVVVQTLFENNTVTQIPDHTLITSEMVVDREGAANTVEINVDITHSDRGNIKLELIAPDGSKYKLKKHQRQDHGQDIKVTYTADVSGDAAGIWTLEIKDQYWGDVGQVNSWSLQF